MPERLSIFLYQLTVVASMFALKALIWRYWRANIQPGFEAQKCDPTEYARRKNSGRYFSFGILSLIFLYVAYVVAVPQAMKSVECQVAFFFLTVIFFCFNLLGVGAGLRYLKEKNVSVTPFGKVALVFEDAIYVVGMVAFHYLSTLESISRK